jgi:general secretion pathway protein C
MKNITNSKLFSTLLFFLTVLVIAKLIWLVLSIQFLPKSGIEYSEKNKLKAFYYPVRLSNSKKYKPKVIVAPIDTKIIQPKKIVRGMKDYKLLALYHTSELLVVTVAKGAKTKVLAQGELFNGFKLKSAGRDYALFNKDGKEFKLHLKNIKVKKAKKTAPKRVAKAVSRSVKKKGIIATDDGATKIVSKGLLSSYTKDIDKVWKDIGIGEHKVNGVLTGFKVNFIKRHSDFEKLGLKRGDILTAINGQELDSYNAAFSFYKEMDSIENLTLSIKRNNQEMELEYEIQ